jgi:hypothetical protein
MKIRGQTEVHLDSLLTLAVDKREHSLRPGRFATRKSATCIQWMGGCVSIKFRLVKKVFHYKPDVALGVPGG